MIISAIATASGRGGVAIVRMSGAGCLDLARAMFSRRREVLPNRMYPGEIDAGTFKDYGFLVYFAAPKSFTGEDMVEFHTHGGTEIPHGVLARTLQLGARLAERGEFTKRAFLNGKLTLSAAEGMVDMINARSEAEVRAGYSLLTEKLSHHGERIAALIKHCLASVEADLDFPEEDLTVESSTEIEHTMSEVVASLKALLSQYAAGRKVKEGVRVAIVGKPNAGKSSLLNALLGFDRAIVSPAAGTTRDTVEGELMLHGVRFLLIDTAGLREGADDLEREGIRRAERAVREADLVVWLKEDDAVTAGAPVITVGAKCDLFSREGCDICVSSVTGEGVEALKELIYEHGYGQENDGAFLLEERHYAAFRRAEAAAERALAAVRAGLGADLYAEDLRESFNALGEITGETATEAVVTEIFEKFCVGK